MTRALLLCSLVILALGCGGKPASGDPAKTTFASTLGVDLTAMHKSPTGLYTQDLQQGTGLEAQPGHTVSVHYTGWFPDGSVFENNTDGSQPFQFVLGQGQVIAGWDEGVSGMKAGGSRRLVIPSSLAYGDTGSPGGTIPPKSVLIFKVQLLSVQ